MNTAVNYTFCILNIQQNANETYPEHTHIHTQAKNEEWRKNDEIFNWYLNYMLKYSC